MSKTEEQGQKQLKPNKCVTILALLATIAAAVAAFYSAHTADKAQSYIESLNRSKISLQDKRKVAASIQDGKAKLELEYTFKIVGQEPVKILNMKIGNFNFKTNEFTVIQDNYSLVNKQFPGNTFRHTVFGSTTFTAPETGLTDVVLRKIMADTTDVQAIIFNIEYRSGEKEKAKVKFYTIFRDGGLRSLSNNEYEQMEGFLPKEFRL